MAREEPVDRRFLLERMCVIAYREIGDLCEEAFFDAAEWIDLAGKAGVGGSACRELGGD